MPVNGLNPSASLTYGRQTSELRSPSTGTTGSLPTAGASRSEVPLLGQVNVTSRIQTTLPNGKTLSVSRVDFGGNDLAASSGVLSNADRQEDNQMMSAFNQLTGYFNYRPRPEDIKLEGTAAIDLSV